MQLESLIKKIPSYAHDVAKNFREIFIGKILADLSDEQLLCIAIAVSYTMKHEQLVNHFRYTAKVVIDDSYINIIKSLVAIMTMNNTLYKFTKNSSVTDLINYKHELHDSVTAGNHDIDIVTFNMCQVAISIINNCNQCADFYVKKLLKRGLTLNTVTSVLKVVAVLRATAEVLEMESLRIYDFFPRGENF